MIKKLLKILTILIIVALFAAAIFFYAIFISVENIKIQYETISDFKIPKSHHNLKIGFFTDINYSLFMNKDRFTKMIDTINTAHPDIVLFGGDLFSFANNNTEIDEQTKSELIDLLKKINAPLGKFAVLGEQDYPNESILEATTQILYQSDFEILHNTMLKIYNQSNEYIQLVGIDSLLNNKIDIKKAFQNVNPNQFTIAFAHCPDSFYNKEMPFEKINLAFAGHSHGSQIYIPFVGPFKKLEGATIYNHGTYLLQNSTLHVSNGVGTTFIDMRLFSPPQFLIYRLEHKELIEDTNSQEKPASK